MGSRDDEATARQALAILTDVEMRKYSLEGLTAPLPCFAVSNVVSDVGGCVDVGQRRYFVRGIHIRPPTTIRSKKM